jgi:hypothetical protein
MSPASGAGSGKETTLTLEALAKRFDSFEEILRSLSTRVTDNEQQTQALNIALLRLEHGNVSMSDKGPAPGYAAAAPSPVASNGEPSGAASRAVDSSVTPPSASNRPAASPPQPRRHNGPDDDADAGEFLPTYHKLDFPKFDGSSDPLPWLNRCEHYFRVRRTPEHKRVPYASFYLLDDA